MDWKMDKFKLVLIFGLIGISGVLLTIVSDLILLGRPDTAKSFFTLGTASMAGISQWRIASGTFLGVFILPFQLAGLVPLYYGLKPTGRFLPAFTILINAHALIMGVAFHGSYAYIANGWKLFYSLGPEEELSVGLMQRFNSYWMFIVVIMMTELVLGSIAYIIQVAGGKSLFPRWMALASPLFVLGILLLVIPVIPAPAGGYVGPTILNASTLLFMALSTGMTCRKLKQQKADSNIVSGGSRSISF